MARAWLLPLVCIAMCPGLRAAESKWIQSRSPAIEVFSDAGSRAALEKLGVLEQLRFALGALMGKPDLAVNPPLRILALKANVYPPALVEGRDRTTLPLAADGPVPGAVLREWTRFLLQRNVARLTPETERGLESFFSTLEVRGAHVLWGAPPAAADRTLDWARVQLLATKPEYYGKLKVLFFNLQNGVADEPAYRNSIGKSKKEFDAELDAYLKAGVFAASDAPSKSMNALRDFPVKPLDAADAELAIADLMNKQSRAAYQRMLSDKKRAGDASEGLALLALRDGDEAAAMKYLTTALDAGTVNARVWLAYAKLETDRPKSNDAIDRALELDPKLAEAHFLLGQRRHKREELKTAISLDPRQASYWNALAEVDLDENRFAEAAKAWRAAEQAASDPAERERMHAAWSKVEGEKLDYQNSERRQAEDVQRQDTERVKAKALAELRATEAKVNHAQGGLASAAAEAVPWEGVQDVHLEGTLKLVECLGKQTRVTIEDAAGKSVKLMAASRAGLMCGPVKPRAVAVDYARKPDAKLGTAGDIVSLR